MDFMGIAQIEFANNVKHNQNVKLVKLRALTIIQELTHMVMRFLDLKHIKFNFEQDKLKFMKWKT